MAQYPPMPQGSPFAAGVQAVTTPARGRGGPGDVNSTVRTTHRQVAVEVRSMIRRIEEPVKPQQDRYFCYHDPAFGPDFRNYDNTRDMHDHDLLCTLPDYHPPLQQLAAWQRSEEYHMKQDLWWMHTFEEMRHPFPVRRVRTDLQPATVCVDPEEHCGLTWLLAG
uniref:Uncharacterized protein n=1 Tax=Alexandrium andersonii TaxID=327968 RepID=A0A7S2IFK5_9DINO